VGISAAITERRPREPPMNEMCIANFLQTLIH
jgi:hypothetical protein